MILLYGILMVAIFCGLPIFIYKRFVNGGPFVLAWELIVLVHMLASLMWLVNRTEIPGSLDAMDSMSASLTWLFSLPWGVIWIIDTCVIVGVLAWYWLVVRKRVTHKKEVI